MKRFLGVDWSQKRVGLAVSDETGKFAFPNKTIAYSKTVELVEQLRVIIEKEDIKMLVIGLPLGTMRQDTLQTQEIRQVATILEKELGLPTVFQDEIFTTKIAEQHSAKNVDASAAALILQAYLDKLQNEK